MLDLMQALFLFGLVLVLVWATTRFVGNRMTAPGRGRLLRVLEQLPAGKDRSIYLLEVGGQLYLVGVTGEQVNVLDRLSSAAGADLLQRADAQREARDGVALPAAFQGLLTKARHVAAAHIPVPWIRAARTPVAAPGETPGEQEAHLRRQIERMRHLAGAEGDKTDEL